MKPLALLLALVALTGCAALGQALGVQPKADAPAYSGVGVVMLHNRDSSADGTARGAKVDQSGAVGASGSASAEATQTVEVPAEVVESLIGAAQALIAAGNPTAASAVLGAIGPAKKAKAEKSAPAAPAPAPAEPVAPAVPQ